MSEERPTCGKCGGEMTPENSSIHPEWFLHDTCLTADDEYDSPEYQAFLLECAKHCRCTHTICDGVLAGGLCDEIIESDEDDEP